MHLTRYYFSEKHHCVLLARDSTLTVFLPLVHFVLSQVGWLSVWSVVLCPVSSGRRLCTVTPASRRKINGFLGSAIILLYFGWPLDLNVPARKT